MLEYSLAYDSNSTAIGPPHHLFSLDVYEAMPSTYPIFKVGTHTDNLLSSTTRIPIKVTARSKSNTASSGYIILNVLLKDKCYLVTPSLKSGYTTYTKTYKAMTTAQSYTDLDPFDFTRSDLAS